MFGCVTRDQRRDLVRELYPKVRSSPKVAEILGCSTTTVWSDLKKLGIPRMSSTESIAIADAEIQRRVGERRTFVAKLYTELRSTYRVAAAVGCSRATVTNDLKALGVAPGQRTKQRGETIACLECGREKWRYECELNEGGLRGRFCSRSCWNTYRWKHGIGISTSLVSLSGRYTRGVTRQRWLGRWGGSKPPGPGARSRGRPRVPVSEKQRSEILKLAGRGWGRPAIAKNIGLTEHRVRGVLESRGPATQ